MDEMAREMVSDGKRPNVFFVSKQVSKDKSEVQLMTRDFNLAYEYWKGLARQPGESCLEDRQTGVICSKEPVSDSPGARLTISDNSNWITKR
jgi:hypothetical protein